MGLTVLPKVGAGENLGPVKQDTPLDYPDVLRDILAAEHNVAMAALEGLGAEVGLHDGSTVGSLVARVTTLEGGGGGGGADPSDATPEALGTADAGTSDEYSRGDHVHELPASIATAQDAAEAAQSTANAALPKPGGTTTANGIAYGTGTTGAAVAISTTTIADLVKRLGNVFTLNANTVLDDSYSGGIIFTDTSGGARQHTIPTTVSAGWNAIFVREGANTLKVIGDGTMLMKGPAAAANEVAIAVDDGGVSVLRRSATKCWCAGKIS